MWHAAHIAYGWKKSEMGIVLICWCLQLQEIFFSVGPEGENVYILAKMPQLSGLKTIYNLCSRYWLFFPQKTLDCYHRSWYLSCIFSLTLFFRFQFLPLFGGRLVPCAKIQIFCCSCCLFVYGCILSVWVYMFSVSFRAVIFFIYRPRDHPPRLCQARDPNSIH